jgi:hypothetical protein
VTKPTRLSERSTWWWNRKGFAWGVQSTLNEIQHLLPKEQAAAIQEWIHLGLRDWVDADDDKADKNGPEFPTTRK